MLRPCLAALLLCACPLAAQTAAGPDSIRSGAAVRVFLRGGTPEGAPGMLVGSTADTLRVISPSLGLARVPVDSIQRIERPGPRAGTEWKYAAMVLGMSVGAGVGDETGGGDFFPMFFYALGVFTAGGAVLYAIEGPERNPAPLDPRAGLTVVRPERGWPGIPVRVATGAGPLAEQRLHDFSADSVYLVADGRLTPVPRLEITSLQVSLGRDRDRGARRGARIGAISGALLLGGTMALLDGGWGLALSPIGALAGGALGNMAGYPVGRMLAPRVWSDVPLPER